MSIVLTSSRVIIKQACLQDACQIAHFFKKNKTFHSSFNPQQHDFFYSADFWIQEVVKLQEEFRRKINCKLFIFDAQNPQVCIGSIDLEQFWSHPIQSSFLGFALDQNYTGKGYMTESLQMLFPFCKNKLHLHKIFATTDINNIKSQALLQRLGFTSIGNIENYIFMNNRWQDHNISYKIL